MKVMIAMIGLAGRVAVAGVRWPAFRVCGGGSVFDGHPAVSGAVFLPGDGAEEPGQARLGIEFHQSGFGVALLVDIAAL